MSHRTSLLGVQVAQGFSPEARVFAGLLAQRNDRYAARVFHQSWDDDRESADAFERLAGVSVERFDVGFRYSPPGVRRFLVQAAARVRLRRALPGMLKAAQSGDASLVYGSQQRWDSQVGAYLAVKLQRPHVIHLHYNVGWWLGRASLDRLRNCAHIVAVSDFVRRQVIDFGIAPDRVTTVRNTMPLPEPESVDTRQAVRDELRLPQDAVVIGSVARLDYYKGQEDAINAFALVADDHPNVRLLLAGDGTPDVRSALEARTAALDVAERVVFTGHRRDVARIHSALDIFVHPARSDPCPLGVLEASAAGLPVVAYAHGGVPELVHHEATGLLVPEGNIGELARALSELVGDPSRRRDLGAAGRSRVGVEFRPRDAGRAFADVVDAVAAAPAGRHASNPR